MRVVQKSVGQQLGINTLPPLKGCGYNFELSFYVTVNDFSVMSRSYLGVMVGTEIFI